MSYVHHSTDTRKSFMENILISEICMMYTYTGYDAVHGLPCAFVDVFIVIVDNERNSRHVCVAVLMDQTQDTPSNLFFMGAEQQTSFTSARHGTEILLMRAALKLGFGFA